VDLSALTSGGAASAAVAKAAGAAVDDDLSQALGAAPQPTSAPTRPSGDVVGEPATQMAIAAPATGAAAGAASMPSNPSSSAPSHDRHELLSKKLTNYREARQAAIETITRNRGFEARVNETRSTSAPTCVAHAPWAARAHAKARRHGAAVQTDFASINDHQIESHWEEQRHAFGAPQCATNFTLVTQASAERLWMLKHICHRWFGPIVVAIYAEQGADAAPREPACYPGQVDYVAVAASKKNFHDRNAYPVNLLRNVAISRVKTSHFLMADIDLWPDSTLLTRLLIVSYKNAQIFDDPKRALVIPAFGREDKAACTSSTAKSLAENAESLVNCHREAALMPFNFETLRQCIIDKKCHIFDRYNQDGHGTTDYKSWLKQGGKATRNIQCFLSNRYEPYVVLRKTPLLPTFEERFRGYGKNKIQNLVHLRYAGWHFSVLSKSFLVHFPHHKSAARLAWEDSAHRARMDDLYKNFLDALMKVYGAPGDRVGCTKICT